MHRFRQVESRRFIEFLNYVHFLTEMERKANRGCSDGDDSVLDDEPELHAASSSVLKHGWELWESRDDTESP